MFSKCFQYVYFATAFSTANKSGYLLSDLYGGSILSSFATPVRASKRRALAAVRWQICNRWRFFESNLFGYRAGIACNRTARDEHGTRHQLSTLTVLT
jgi:hypothetical protein